MKPALASSLSAFNLAANIDLCSFCTTLMPFLNMAAFTLGRPVKFLDAILVPISPLSALTTSKEGIRHNIGKMCWCLFMALDP